MEKKFLVIYTTGNQPQYVTVFTDDLEEIVQQFAEENVMRITDRFDGNEMLFNMANISFMAIRPWKDQNRG